MSEQFFFYDDVIKRWYSLHQFPTASDFWIGGRLLRDDVCEMRRKREFGGCEVLCFIINPGIRGRYTVRPQV